MRVLNLWQKNGVFKIEVIQPLLDMAAGSSSSAEADDGPDGGKAHTCPENIVLSLYTQNLITNAFLQHLRLLLCESRSLIPW